MASAATTGDFGGHLVAGEPGVSIGLLTLLRVSGEQNKGILYGLYTDYIPVFPTNHQ